jgi:hypothetical protein
MTPSALSLCIRDWLDQIRRSEPIFIEKYADRTLVSSRITRVTRVSDSDGRRMDGVELQLTFRYVFLTSATLDHLLPSLWRFVADPQVHSPLLDMFNHLLLGSDRLHKDLLVRGCA